MEEIQKIGIEGRKSNILTDIQMDDKIREEFIDIIKTIWDTEVQQTWTRIDNSTTNHGYKSIKKTVGMEDYLTNKEINDKDRITWTRDTLRKRHKKTWTSDMRLL